MLSEQRGAGPGLAGASGTTPAGTTLIPHMLLPGKGELCCVFSAFQLFIGRGVPKLGCRPWVQPSYPAERHRETHGPWEFPGQYNADSG